jgi:exopolyphosphatase / guanosine-5'-triphosphate,3'-diphosphate pyrophosphatase
VRVLRAYREKLNEFGIVSRDRIHVVATSAVREATNRLAFLKRIYVATGFQVEPFDEAAVNRVTFLGVRPLFQTRPDLAEGRTLIVEVGGGSTQVLLFHGGDVAHAQIYRLGALRLRRTIESYHAPTGKVRKIMESQIQRCVSQIRQRIPRDQGPTMIALGGDVRFAVEQLGAEWDSSGLGLAAAGFAAGTDRGHPGALGRGGGEGLSSGVHRCGSGGTGPAGLRADRGRFGAGRDPGFQHQSARRVDQRDGAARVLDRGLRASDHPFGVDYGRRLGFDEAHGRHIAELSRVLFRALQREHGLDSRYEVILYIAALLHDLGYVVNARSHHKHSMYLIMHGELFGLSERDVTLAALTARYHRRSTPRPIHPLYASLDWESQTNVAKMAAILRVADALDRSGGQRIRDIACTREDGALVISVPTGDDLSLEQLSLSQKGKMFTEIFGMPVVLRNATEL